MRQVVRAFLQNKEWKFLLVKHPMANNWTLPWGHIEKNETIYEALHREIKEEFNLNIEILWNKVWFERIDLKEFTSPLSIYEIKYVSNKHWAVEKLEYIFLAKIISWEIKIQEDEIADYNFFTKEEILWLDNTFVQIKEILKKI